MSAAHAVRPVGDEFLEAAPLVVRVAVDLDAPPSAVFDVLASERMWSWLPLIDRLRWTTPSPQGEGSVRVLRIARLFEVEERFYRWDAGRRATFHVTSATRPVLNALAEDFLVEPAGAGSRLTWTFALDPKLPGARLLGRIAPLLAPGNRWAIGGIRRLL